MENYTHKAWLDHFMERWCRLERDSAQLVTQKAYNAFCDREGAMRKGEYGSVYQRGKYKPSSGSRSLHPRNQ